MFKKSIALLCASTIIAAPSLAMADTSDPYSFRISRSGDTELSCAELSQEAALMHDIIAATKSIKDSSKRQEHGITAAGALGSLLVGTMTAGLGLAAAGFLATQEVEEQASDADNVQDIAEQRRSFMIGIYNAKSCFGPIEHVLLDPVTAPPVFANNHDAQVAAIEPAAGPQSPAKDRASKPRYNN